VYAINPRSKAPYSYLQQFTLTEDVTAENDGTATLKISPPIITSGPFQTVSAAPDNSAAVQWMGSDTETATDETTYNYGTIFRKEALVLVSAKLTMPHTGEA